MIKEQRYFEVTRKQIFLAVVIASIALTIVFNIGLYVGKKRVINAEIKSEQEFAKKILSDMESSSHKINSVRSSIVLQNPMGITKNEQPDVPKQTSQKAQAKESKPPKQQEKADISNEKKSTDQFDYTVKIGAFSQKENAEKMINLLKSDGYEPWIESENNMYHVMLGRFSNAQIAGSFGDKLQSKPYMNGYMIKQISKK